MAGLLIPPYGPAMGMRPQVPLAPSGQPNPADLMGLGQVFQRLRTPGSQPMPMPQIGPMPQMPPQMPQQPMPPVPGGPPPMPGGPMGVPPVGAPMAMNPMAGGMNPMNPMGGMPGLDLQPDLFETQQQVSDEIHKPIIGTLSPQDRVFRASANLSRYRGL